MEKPDNLGDEECWCSTSDGFRSLILTGNMEAAAKSMAQDLFHAEKAFQNSNSLRIFVERGDGVSKNFTVIAEETVNFLIRK